MARSPILHIHQLTYQDTLAHQLEVFLESMDAIRGVRQTTLRRHRSALRDFLEAIGDVPVSSIMDRHLECYIRTIRERGNKPQTIKTKMLSIEAFFHFLVRKRLIEENPVDLVDKILVPDPEPYVFSKDQIDVLLSLPDTRTEVGLRDWALMIFLIGTGVRIGELLQLQVLDVDFRSGQILVRSEYTKTRRSRTIPMAAMVKEALRKYLARRERMGSLADPNLFVSVRDRGGKSLGLTRGAVNYRLKHYVEKSGVPWDNTRVSPHTFRHAFATQWIVNGGDVESLMKILGHRNPKMLAYYVNLAIPDLQTKNDKFNPLNHVSARSIESPHHSLGRVMQRASVRSAEEGEPLPRTGFKPAFCAEKIARLWDEDEP